MSSNQTSSDPVSILVAQLLRSHDKYVSRIARYTPDAVAIAGQKPLAEKADYLRTTPAGAIVINEAVFDRSAGLPNPFAVSTKSWHNAQEALRAREGEGAYPFDRLTFPDDYQPKSLEAKQRLRLATYLAVLDGLGVKADRLGSESLLTGKNPEFVFIHGDRIVTKDSPLATLDLPHQLAIAIITEETATIVQSMWKSLQQSTEPVLV